MYDIAQVLGLNHSIYPAVNLKEGGQLSGEVGDVCGCFGFSVEKHAVNHYCGYSADTWIGKEKERPTKAFQAHTEGRIKSSFPFYITILYYIHKY